MCFESQDMGRAWVEQELAWELTLNAALAELYEPLASPSSTIQDVATIVLHHAQDLTASEHGFVSSIDSLSGDNIIHTLTEMVPDQCQNGDKEQPIVFSRGRDGNYPGLWGHALNTRQAFYHNTSPEHPASKGLPPGHLPVHRFLAVPVMLGHQLVGEIALSNAERDYTVRDIEAVLRLAGFYALAIQRMRAQEELKQYQDHLEELVQERTAELQKEIAERARAEVALRTSEHAYRTLAENLPGIVYRLWLNQDRRMQFFNTMLEAMTGFQAQELTKGQLCSIEPLVLPEDREKVTSAVQRACEENQLFQVEYRIQHKNGQVRHFMERGKPVYQPGGTLVYIDGVILDVTEHVQAEEALRRRNRELALLNHAGQAFTSNLELDQTLATVLEEIRRLLKISATSIWLIERESHQVVCHAVTNPQSDVVRGWRLPLGQGLVGWVAQKGETLYVPDVEDDPRHFKGVDQETGLPLRSILSVPLRTRQKVIGVLQIVDTQVDRFGNINLTLVESLAAEAAIALENARLYAEEKQRASELARALEQQRELDRLKSEFIQNVSHELRTPLAIARGYAELLLDGDLGELQPEQREPVSIITRRTRMLTQMIDDLMALLNAEMHDPKREPVDLITLAEGLLVDFQVTAQQRDLNLTAQIDPHVSPVSGDTNQLHRVLDNLLGNAFKFTPAGGDITLHLYQEDANVMIEVSDTGIGISSEQLERIFERFYQVDGSPTRRYGGTGLGLALVKEIVDAHGGQVSVESIVGQGSTFHVTLPAHSED